MAIVSSKQKLDELFGITDSQSIDDFLDNMSLEADKVQETMSTIDDSVKQNLENIDRQMEIAKTSGNSILALQTMDLSLKEVEELIGVSKQLFKHIAEQILTTDLIDSEAIGSAAKLLEGIHINIAEFINMYKEKSRFVDKIKLLTFQQEQKKELMRLKHQFDMEKIQNKTDSKTIDAESVTFDYDALIKSLDNEEKEKLGDN